MKRAYQTTYQTLKQWRHAARLSQHEAANLLGLSQAHYGKLERGTHATTGKRAKGIVEKTGVPLAVLVGAA